MVIHALGKAFRVAKPLILNSDQGCQFTSNEYIEFLKGNNIRQSMDGKSRWADNIMIERWFRSFKYEEAYLTQYANSDWGKYQFEPCNIVAIYQWLGEDLMYSDIDSMKNHIRGKMKAGGDESLIDLLDESKI